MYAVVVTVCTALLGAVVYLWWRVRTFERARAAAAGERERTAAALRESEYLLEESQRVSRMGSYVFDITNGVWNCSAGLNEVFGIGATHPRTVDGWLALIPADEREQMRTYLLGDVIAAGGTFDRVYRIVRVNDGASRWVHGRGVLVFGGNNAPIKMTGTIQDVTERRELEEGLLQARKMESIGRLAGGVAHDFNNLLTVINGYASLLERALLREPALYSQAAEIRKAGERGAALIAQLLTFSGRHEPHTSRLDLNQFIQDAEAMLRHMAGEAAELVVEFSPEPAMVEMDPVQMMQVITNLVTNARDAMPEGGVVRIITAGDTASHTVTLTVLDTGLGMDEATRQRVFEPFYTTKMIGNGAGLGLAIVHGIVEQANGHVSVESEIGAGTRFTISLPMAEAVETPLEPIAGADASTVLLVERHENARHFMAVALRDMGYRVVEAADTKSAARLARDWNGPISLLVVDAVLLELAVRVRELRPGLRILLVSSIAPNAAALPGAVYLRKPFTLEALTRKVREALDR